MVVVPRMTWAMVAGTEGQQNRKPRTGGPRVRAVRPFAWACVTVISLVTSCWDTNDYATDDCLATEAPPVANFWAGEGSTDVTFLAFGDTQYYLDHGLGYLADVKNDLQVAALNAVAGNLRWDRFGVQQEVSNIRGVIMAGDITQNGRDDRSEEDDEYGEFIEDYGLCGNRKLALPIFEGYGNHDYFEWSDLRYRVSDAHPVADSVSARNPHRVGVVNKAKGKAGHYAWEWDTIHFVNVNLAPSDVVPEHNVKGVRDPRGALSFLRDDLKEFVKGTDKRVVLVSHYGPAEDFEFGWDAEQIEAARKVLEPYPVIAWIHGHDHGTSHYVWKGIPIYNVGSPYFSEYQGGRFSVFRITDDAVYAGDAHWDPDNPTLIDFPANWQSVVGTEEP